MSKVEAIKDKGRKEWVEEYLQAPKYIQTVSKWSDNVTHWKMQTSSRFKVKLFGAGSIEYPLSRMIVVMNDINSVEYSEMLKRMAAMYGAVRKAKLKVNHDWDVDQYAVAWCSERRQFFRVRIVDFDESECQLVLALDAGRKFLVKEKHLYPICEDLLKLRPMVVRVRLFGLDQFDHCEKMRDLMRKIRWTEDVLEFEVTRIAGNGEKKRIYGKLREPGVKGSINSTLLLDFWLTAVRPTLPPARESQVRARVVHAEKDGTIYLQLIDSMSSALEDYLSISLAKINNLRDNPKKLEKKKAVIPLNPDLVYVVTDGKQCIRVKLAQSEPVGSLNKQTVSAGEKVELWAMDLGKRLFESPESLLVGSRLHQLLEKVPAQCIQAKLAGVDELNVGLFLDSFCQAEQDPFIVHIESPGTELEPAQVALYGCTKDDGRRRKSMTRLVNVNQELKNLNITTGIGIASSTKDLALKPRPLEEQLESIDARSLSPWTNKDKREALAPGSRISFRITKVIDRSEFYMQPVTAVTTIRQMSKEIGNWVSSKWMQNLLYKHIDHPLRSGWFYAYKLKEKDLFVRVRLLKKHQTNRVTVLLVDFGDCIEVSALSLMLPLPLSTCKIGPLAAKVQNFDLRELNPLSPDQYLDLEGRACKGTVKGVNHDDSGLTIVELSSLQVIAGVQ